MTRESITAQEEAVSPIPPAAPSRERHENGAGEGHEETASVERRHHRVRLRAGRIEDAEASGSIVYGAFKAIADQHNFPPTSPRRK